MISFSNKKEDKQIRTERLRYLKGLRRHYIIIIGLMIFLMLIGICGILGVIASTIYGIIENSAAWVISLILVIVECFLLFYIVVTAQIYYNFKTHVYAHCVRYHKAVKQLNQTHLDRLKLLGRLCLIGERDGDITYVDVYQKHNEELVSKRFETLEEATNFIDLLSKEDVSKAARR